MTNCGIAVVVNNYSEPDKFDGKPPLETEHELQHSLGGVAQILDLRWKTMPRLDAK